MPGLGVRVRPSGGRSYIQLQKARGQSKRVFLGPISTRRIAEVRQECHARKANPEPEDLAVPRRRQRTTNDAIGKEDKRPAPKPTLHRTKPRLASRMTRFSTAANKRRDSHVQALRHC